MPTLIFAGTCKTLLVLLVSIWMAACATIDDTEQIVSIDSNPRGIAVYQDKARKKKIGETPFFKNIEREYSHTFYFALPPTGAKQLYEKKINCAFRWGTTLLGNLPLIAIPVTFSPAYIYFLGLGIDLLTGAAFDCPHRFTLNLPRQSSRLQSPKTTCHSYLILPPFDNDEKTSDQVAQYWRTYMLPGLSPCETIIDYTKSKALFLRYKLNTYNEISWARINKHHLNQISHQLQATHIVKINHQKNRTRLTVKAQIFDAHTYKSISKQQRVFDVSRSKTFQFSQAAGAWVKYFQVIPNAFGWAPSETNLVAPLPDNAELINITDLSTFPNYISNLNLINVIHPISYATWDFAFKFAPAFLISYLSKRATLEIPLPPPRKNNRPPLPLKTFAAPTPNLVDGLRQSVTHDIDLFFFSVPLVTSLDMFTPIGTFSTELGIGPVFSWFNESVIASDWRIRTLVSLTAAYTGFFANNFFIRIQTSSNVGLSNLASYHRFQIKGWDETRLTIGYYFPRLTSLARNLLW